MTIKDYLQRLAPGMQIYHPQGGVGIITALNPDLLSVKVRWQYPDGAPSSLSLPSALAAREAWEAREKAFAPLYEEVGTLVCKHIEAPA